MDLRAVLLSILVFHDLGGASYIIKQTRLRRILASSTDCEKGFYFDPVLEEKGRCQPCSEICGEGPHQIGGEDACARHKDQCEVVQEESTQVPLPITPDYSPPNTTQSSDSTTVIAVAVATLSLAVLTTGILVCFLVRNCRRRSNADNDDRTSAPRLINPVESNSFRASKDKICVNLVNNEPLEAHQMALLQSQHVREFSSLDQNEASHNGIICREPSVHCDA